MYGGTTAVLLLPFGVIVREEEANPPRDPADWPADDGETASFIGLPSPGLTGRHRIFERAVPEPRALPPSPESSSSATPSAPWGPEVMTPWRHAFEPRTTRREAQAPDGAGGNGNGAASPGAVSAPPAEPVRSGPTSSGSHLGMPIRVPQSSLAPQLRAQHKAGQQQAAATVEVPRSGKRSPEATRDMLILMQQGWQAGRVDDLDDPHDAPDNGTD
jgi:hypothetical protein